MLNAHVIARIESRTLQRSYPRAIPRNAKGGYHGQHAKVQVRIVRTDQGAMGWGMSGGPDEAVQALVGRRVSELIDPARGAAPEARVLDVPLHDLAGKILGLPVWKMLGGAGGPRVEVYAGGIYFDELEPPENPRGLEAILAACAQDAEAGHAHFKLKIGRGAKVMARAAGDRRDIEVTRLVRERHPKAKLLVDANDGYDSEGYCRYLDAVMDCGLFWVEEPFREEPAGLRRLRAKLAERSPATLIADGEARNGPTQDPPGPFGKWPRDQLNGLLALGREKLLDVLLMDVSAMGFTAWRTLMPELQAAGVLGSPHAWGEPLKTLYAAQLAGGLGNVNIVEGVPGATEGVDATAYALKDGVLTLPEQPGFGLELAE
ncbi:MAG: mandelate racemase [Planctomycetota bacterium]|nr:mandelate racemase [Planctomycetota bacterium]